MKSLLKRLWNDDRGNALIIAGAAMPLIIGSAGLTTDTIQWTLWKRQLQRAADSAALAGVYAKAASQDAAAAVTADVTYNQTTGISLKSGYPIVTYPANTSTYTDAVAVEMRIAQPLSFSGMFISTPDIKANATAAIAQAGTYCVVSLENTSTSGIIDSGNATVNLGCGMITNSTSLNAAIATGSASVNASPVAAVGGIQQARQWGNSSLLPFTVAEADPYAGVTIDRALVTNCKNDPRVGPNDHLTDTTGATNSTSDDALSPGCYNGLTLNGEVKLKPGTYYINGGTSNNPNGLDIGAQAKVDGTAGVTIVLTNTDSNSTKIGNLTINGNAEVKLTAPTSGTYKGLAIYQDRNAPNDGSTSSSPNLVNGNSNSYFNGAFYFPNQQVGFNGNGGLHTNCFQLVSRRVEFKGNMTVSNNCTSTDPSNPFAGRHARLVA